MLVLIATVKWVAQLSKTKKCLLTNGGMLDMYMANYLLETREFGNEFQPCHVLFNGSVCLNIYVGTMPIYSYTIIIAVIVELS